MLSFSTAQGNSPSWSASDCVEAEISTVVTMAWAQLTINRPHLAYIILGGFTSIFMLVSLFIKEKLYIGEATVATLVGVIFGPHAANLFSPQSWGNTDQITLECSRIVLVVQCFAVGVELPKSYMERHWRSVVFLLLPVMTYGWLATSLFIWWMVEPLTWLESLACAACVTATDPVLASSVVGKGKFAKRVPKHLRDVLSAESGCNDGMAFPFIYLSLYLIRYRPDAGEVTFHWVCFIILYECIFGAVYGFLVGYIARHAIKQAEKVGIIDRESFLVFYFVLALFCAGSGSLLGMDDLLIGFSAGVGFSNDGWFTEKTEESHVSNVIDLLLNLAYFVYLGSVIPWEQYNAPSLGLTPWRLVVISIFVILFRRIPIMLALKPIIPDVKTWREALFAGHFGPIGVGAIFAAILARAELETDTATPLAVLPTTAGPDGMLIHLIWPITTFLVVSSILVHGSSIAVFTLGKRINTLSLTLSYTQDVDSKSWMDRLPRISSQSRSMNKSESLESLEKPEFPPNTLPPIGLPRNFLRRQKEDEERPSRSGSRASSLKPSRRRKVKDPDLRPGGPVSASAIMPTRKSDPLLTTQESGSDTMNEKSEEPSPDRRQERGDYETGVGPGPTSPARESRPDDDNVDVEVFQEGDEMIIEDEEGNVLRQEDTRHDSPEDKARHIYEARRDLAHETSGEHAKHKHEPHARNEGEEIKEEVEAAAGHPESSIRKQLGKFHLGKGKKTDEEEAIPPERHATKKKHKSGPERRRGPAHAYQFGNTIIVEDEDGEVVKKYTIPAPERPKKTGGDGGWIKRTTSVVGGSGEVKKNITRMGTWVGLGGGTVEEADKAAATAATDTAGHHGAVDVDHDPQHPDSDDDGIRYTVSKTESHGPFGTRHQKPDQPTIMLGSGRRLSKDAFIKQIQSLDPKSRALALQESSAPEDVKLDVQKEANIPDIPAEDYFSPKRSLGRTRSGSAPMMPSSASRFQSWRSQFQSGKTPQAEDRSSRLEAQPRTENTENTDTRIPRPSSPDRPPTSDSFSSSASDETPAIPTHDISSTLARYVDRSTAAAQRRDRLIAQPPALPNVGENPQAEENEEEEEEGETAAERRRRLAALGTSKGEESSSDEDENAPRHTKGEPQFATPAPVEDAPSAGASTSGAHGSYARKMRISWGGERGREAREKQGKK